MSFDSSIHLSNIGPSASEFVALRSACGWGDVSIETAQRALAAGISNVTVRRAGQLLGFGRIVGDGVLYFYVQDVIVAPGARGHGIGGIIMERLLNQVREIAPIGATIGLMAAKGKEGFYERFGFSTRPAPSYGAGMTLFIN